MALIGIGICGLVVGYEIYQISKAISVLHDLRDRMKH